MVKPYQHKETSKKSQVEEMFNNISPHYDRLNHILSMNIDKRWRKNVIKILKKRHPKSILDVATGTGDFALQAARLDVEKITGVDLSDGMLNIARKKVKEKGLEDKIELIKGDSEALPFEDNQFDASIVTFGVRNFENLEQGLTEIKRVLKPTGKIVVLEFSTPRVFPFKQLYHFYFNKILPAIGTLLSKDNSAYKYLPESVKRFPDGKEFTTILDRIGFVDTSYKLQTFGVATIYVGQKPLKQ